MARFTGVEYIDLLMIYMWRAVLPLLIYHQLNINDLFVSSNPLSTTTEGLYFSLLEN